MSDRPTPETDAETMQDEMDHVDSDIGPFAPSNTVPAEFARKLERERDEAMKLSLKFRDALVSIEEYWNRDQNETAMADACWHAVNMAHDALAEAKEVLL